MVAPLYGAELSMSIAGEFEHLKKQDEFDLAKKMVDQLNKAAVNAAAKAAEPNATAEHKKAAKDAADAAKTPRLRCGPDRLPGPAAARRRRHPGGRRIAARRAQRAHRDHFGRRRNLRHHRRPLRTHRQSRRVLERSFGDRIRCRPSRPRTAAIPSPALTMGLMVQPRIIEAIAANRDFVGRGLLARFLYATPVSKVGFRNSAAIPVAETTEKQYEHWIKKLASEMAEWSDDPAMLQLDLRAEAESASFKTPSNRHSSGKASWRRRRR